MTTAYFSAAMMTAATREQAVDVLVAARRAREPMPHLPEALRPATLADAYAIQEALTRRLGEAPAGWKIACTNPKAQEVMQTTESFSGPLFASMIHESPATLPADAFTMRMIVGEFAFRLGAWPVSMTVSGKTVGTGTGAMALGDPLLSLLWLVNKRASQGKGLRAGEIVTTGTGTGNFMAAPGARTVADFGELGQATVTFTA